jgi:hypothetical protein
MGLRSYARAKAQLDDAKHVGDLKISYWHERVMDTQEEIMDEIMGRKHGA